jgi:2-C-methyl-D-erythritol 4-phosphate cytidylyltransferase
MNNRQAHAVILASGSRLWRLSRPQGSKQFLSLDGESSLLPTTVHRLSPMINAKNVLIVTQERHDKGEAYDALLQDPTSFDPVHISRDSSWRLSWGRRYSALRRPRRQIDKH